MRELYFYSVLTYIHFNLKQIYNPRSVIGKLVHTDLQQNTVNHKGKLVLAKVCLRTTVDSIASIALIPPRDFFTKRS